jgi:hypothetical protein
MRSVCLCIPRINFRMPEPIFMKLGMYIMTPEAISTPYFINPSHQSMCLPGKIVTAATNTQAKLELLDASFSMRSVSLQRNVGD